MKAWKWVAVVVAVLLGGLVLPLVLVTTGGDHASGRAKRESTLREWASLQTPRHPHWPFGQRLGFPPRRVIRIPTRSGYAAELWVAPTRNGNFCTLVAFKNGGGGGCVVRAAGVIAPVVHAPGSITRQCFLHGPYLLEAAVNDARADAVDIVYADGATKRLSLVRVERPINASFFLYELPRDRLTLRTHPRYLRAVDRRGDEVARTSPWLKLAAPTWCTSLS